MLQQNDNTPYVTVTRFILLPKCTESYLVLQSDSLHSWHADVSFVVMLVDFVPLALVICFKMPSVFLFVQVNT